MTMEATINVIAGLAAKGVIESYAIAGAVAALAYIEPTLTEDLDILVSVDAFTSRPSGLLTVGPVEQALEDMGYPRSGIGHLVEGWPVQFIPVADAIDEEALQQAIEIPVTGTLARCLRAEHVVTAALKVGRLKDLARIDAFLDQGAVDLEALKSVIQRHHLIEAWRKYCTKAERADPLGLI